MATAAKQALRAGLVGLGGAAERIHVPALRQVAGVELAGGCDPSAEARASASARFGLTDVFESTEQLLAEHKPDFVVIGSPPELASSSAA